MWCAYKTTNSKQTLAECLETIHTSLRVAMYSTLYPKCYKVCPPMGMNPSLPREERKMQLELGSFEALFYPQKAITDAETCFCSRSFIHQHSQVTKGRDCSTRLVSLSGPTYPQAFQKISYNPAISKSYWPYEQWWIIPKPRVAMSPAIFLTTHTSLPPYSSKLLLSE